MLADRPLENLAHGLSLACVAVPRPAAAERPEATLTGSSPALRTSNGRLLGYDLLRREPADAPRPARELA